MSNAARVGGIMMDRLRGWKETHPLVGDVRGRGLMIGIELVKDKATREPANALRNRLEILAFERGLMVLGCGETTIRLCPALIVSEEEATVALDILEEALTLVEKEQGVGPLRDGPVLLTASPAFCPARSPHLVFDVHVRDLRGAVRGPFQVVGHLLRGQALLLGRRGHLPRKPGQVFGLAGDAADSGHGG